MRGESGGGVPGPRRGSGVRGLRGLATTTDLLVKAWGTSTTGPGPPWTGRSGNRVAAMPAMTEGQPEPAIAVRSPGRRRR